MDLSLRPSPSESIQAELDAFARAFGGAVLFGIPLLFTMEMWWIGESQAPLHLLGLVLLAFAANVVLARMSGFRADHGSWLRDAAEAFEAMAAGVVLSIVVLVVLGRIDQDASASGFFGMVALQVVPLSVGAMVGNLVFDSSRGRTGDADARTAERSPLRELLDDLGATFVGAMFIGFTIAPTEEVPMLAAALRGSHVFGLIAFSLFAAYLIVFASGFDRSHHDRDVGGLFQSPFSETMLCYLVSLVASFVLLVAFGQVELHDPLGPTLVRVLVLGVPASIGGAAGRVVV